MIGNLKCISGFEENLLVKDRLLPNPSAPWHLYGAIVETEAMYRLFLSKDFDELLYVKRNQKKPTNDISARKRSSRWNIEVTSIEPSKMEKKQWEILDLLEKELGDEIYNRLYWVGHLHNPEVDKEQLDRIIEKLNDALDDVFGKKYVEVDCEEIGAEFYFALPEKRKKIEEKRTSCPVGEDKDALIQSFTMQAVDFSFSHRMDRKIGKKKRQLTDDVSSVIYIDVGSATQLLSKNLHFPFSPEKIKRKIRKYKWIQSVVVVSKRLHVGRYLPRFQGYRFDDDETYNTELVSTKQRGGLMETIVVIHNSECKFANLPKIADYFLKY
jgi:hypothetical protein